MYFAFDSDDLSPRSREKLRGNLDVLSKCPGTLVRLDGFADWVGAPSYNRPLSQRRAEAVRNFYVSNGFDADRFLIRGNGEIQPPCPSSRATDRGCRAFRRVESVIVVREAVAGNGVGGKKSSGKVDRPAASSASPAGQPPGRAHWALVVASLSTRDRAEDAAQTFRARLPELADKIQVYEDAPRRHRVVLRTFRSPEDARRLQRRYGTDLPSDTWMVKIDSSDGGVWAQR